MNGGGGGCGGGGKGEGKGKGKYDRNDNWNSQQWSEDSHTRKGWQQQKFVPRHSHQHQPALLTIRGNVTLAHDRFIAEAIAMRLSSALVANTSIPVVHSASEHGSGWRSKLVQASRGDDTAPVAAHRTASHFDIEEEVAARLRPVEAEIRSQVELQAVDGIASHDGRYLVGDVAHSWTNAAKHNYNNAIPFGSASLTHLRHTARARYDPAVVDDSISSDPFVATEAFISTASSCDVSSLEREAAAIKSRLQENEASVFAPIADPLVEVILEGLVEGEHVAGDENDRVLHEHVMGSLVSIASSALHDFTKEQEAEAPLAAVEAQAGNGDHFDEGVGTDVEVVINSLCVGDVFSDISCPYRPETIIRDDRPRYGWRIQNLCNARGQGMHIREKGLHDKIRKGVWIKRICEASTGAS